MEKEKLILIGGGGHCKSCIDVIESTGTYEISGILDLPETLGQETLGYKVIGNDDDIKKFHKEGFSFLITLGQIKSANRRKQIFEFLEQIGAKTPIIISNKATVSQYSRIGKGTVVMHGTLINAEAEIGENCIVNSGAIIEHDAKVGNHTHISTHAVVNGNGKIGSECFLGSNACISSQISVSDKIIIGAGSTIISTITEKGIYAGTPAKKINEK